MNIEEENARIENARIRKVERFVAVLIYIIIAAFVLTELWILWRYLANLGGV
jgi:hypothetical protein